VTNKRAFKMTSNQLFADSSRVFLMSAFVLFLVGCGGGGSSQDKPAPSTSKELA
jgi:hypothetical protein